MPKRPATVCACSVSSAAQEGIEVGVVERSRVSVEEHLALPDPVAPPGLVRALGSGWRPIQ